VAALVLLDPSIFARDVGWRLAFGMGAILGVGILLVRRQVPESPRWLFIHGREEEAERIVDEIEREVVQEVGHPLPEPDQEILVRQRDRIPFREIATVAFRRYPQRSILCLALVVGQAFLYNAVTFDLGTVLHGFFDVGSGSVPYFMVIFAVGNFLGPLLLGRLFDTVGRRPMIAGTYFASALCTVVLALLLRSGELTAASFIAMLGIIFFVASAGASSAYLTVSEVFPMETRALAIAFFFAIGTAIGGITGPALFGQFVHSGKVDQVATGFFIGAFVMALGGLAELRFGVEAAQRPLEEIARPLTAEEVDVQPPARTLEQARLTSERDARIGERARRYREHDRAGLRRLRPGPGSSFYSPGMAGTAGAADRHAAVSELDLDREIELLCAILEEHGTCDRAELSRLVDGRSWGPGRFRTALRDAVDEGRIRRGPGDSYAATSGPA
jgi:MFS family permease